MTMRKAALCLAAWVVAGCGMTPTATVKAPSRVAVKAAQPSRAVTLEVAISRSMAHAQATWGGEWTLKRAFGQKAWGPSGVAQGSPWQVNLLGRLPGEAGHRYVRLQVDPAGAVSLDPRNANGPFADPWHSDKVPSLTPTTMLPAEQGLAIALASRLGTKYPPQTPISYEAGWADRLKQVVTRYRWSCVVDNKRWWLEVVLDPATGEIVELDATHE